MNITRNIRKSIGEGTTFYSLENGEVLSFVPSVKIRKHDNKEKIEVNGQRKKLWN